MWGKGNRNLIYLKTYSYENPLILFLSSICGVSRSTLYKFFMLNLNIFKFFSCHMCRCALKWIGWCSINIFANIIFKLCTLKGFASFTHENTVPMLKALMHMHLDPICICKQKMYVFFRICCFRSYLWGMERESDYLRTDVWLKITIFNILNAFSYPYWIISHNVKIETKNILNVPGKYIHMCDFCILFVDLDIIFQ